MGNSQYVSEREDKRYWNNESNGISKKNIMKIFLIQGMILGGIGIAIGTLISLTFLWYIKNNTLDFITSIYYITKIPVEILSKRLL